MKAGTRINPPCISRKVKKKQLFRNKGIVIAFLHSLKNRSFELNIVQSFFIVAKHSERKRTRKLTVTVVALSSRYAKHS